MKVCLAGDLFLGGDLSNTHLDTDVIQSTAFIKADERVVNLEQSIQDQGQVADKGTLYTKPEALKWLKKLGIKHVSIANNHIHDSGEQGIKDTYSHISKLGAFPFGAGECLHTAKKAVYLNETTALLGYCEFGKPYLKNIMVASGDKPGINPLRLENILEDLNNLPETHVAILYFHWGREHVFLPPYADIQLVKMLLKHPKVLTIVGMHAHRPQGYIEAYGKRAYMCLGNFLFPNFFITPPTQICYPEKRVLSYETTRQYHSVYKLTYKKWRWINRISILVNYDTLSKKISHVFTYQDDKKPVTRELSGTLEAFLNIFIWLLSQLYKLPLPVYVPLEKSISFITYKLWNFQILIKRLDQLGLKMFIKKSLRYLFSKRNLQ